MDGDPTELSFSSFEARIKAMPDGPASVLKTPRAIYWLNVGGTIVEKVSGTISQHPNARRD